MNAIDVAGVAVRVLVGFMCLAAATQRWGWLYGVVAGCVGVVLPVLMTRALIGMHRLVIRNRPDMPSCRTGRCSGRMYRVISADAVGARFRCECGDEYLLLNRKASGRKQLVRIEGGAVVPYMSHGRCEPWTAD